MSTLLEYKRWEDDWFASLPLGNGRIGAMVCGSPEKEVIEINEKSLWSGRKSAQSAPFSTPEALAEIRTLFFEENFDKARELCAKTLRTNAVKILSFQSMCSVTLDFFERGPVSDYKRELELRDAVIRAEWARDTRRFTARSFISEEYDTFFYRFESSAPVSLAIDMKRDENAYTSALSSDTLILRGRLAWSDRNKKWGIDAGEGMSFGANLKVLSDGTLLNRGNTIYVSNATSVTLIGAFKTNYSIDEHDIDPSIDIPSELEKMLSRAVGAGFDKALESHVKTWKSEFDRARLEIDAPLPTIYDMTDMRLEVMKYQSQYDPAMFALYFNYGRYLLLASSGFNANLPANLQGIWCKGSNPPWGSDYHNNINIEMNYWPCDMANISSAFEPFFNYVKHLSEVAAPITRDLYHTRGWTTHLVSDVFGYVGSSGRNEGVFPMAGPWLCLNLFEHFEFTRDFDYLERLYPILRSSCEFLVDFLVEDKEGFFVTCPSNSPENEFFYIDRNGEKKRSTLTCGSAIDKEIVYAILTRGLWAARKLGDEVFAKELENTVSRLSPLKVSERYGTVAEWNEDYEETEPGHRHVSHLFGLYPGDQINETDEILYAAARKSLERRISHGSGGTGWSIAWFVNFWARLHDSENADLALWNLVRNFTTHNLFDQHPPFPLFQIDGNLGGTAGIVEMLLQSHLGKIDERIIEIFPAVPKRWNKGRVFGLRARGGFTVDIEWDENRPISVKISTDTDNTLRIKKNFVFDSFNASREYLCENNVIVFSLKKGESVEFTF